MSKEAKSEPKAKSAKRARVSQTDVPAYPLEQALRVAQALRDNYASRPAKPLDVAVALDMSPSSSTFRMLTGSAIAYGLTEGGYNATEISLTELGKRIVSPLTEGDDYLAMREALLRPRVIGDFLKKYNNSPVPPEKIACNVLESMEVPTDRVSDVLALIVTSARELGMLQELKGKSYVNLDRIVSSCSSSADEQRGAVDKLETTQDSDDEVVERQPLIAKLEQETGEESQRKRRVFITHGKDTKFVEPIKKLLQFGELEAVVSVEKQSVSQPVPEKVMNDMRSCGAAIIHVQGEQVLMDKNAEEQIALNPNVLIEIGAAMALYGKRFILLVKDGTKLPSNLQGLYEVRYEGDALDGNATIKLLEAINEMKKA